MKSWFCQWANTHNFEYRLDRCEAIVSSDLHDKIEFQYLPLKRCVKLNRTQLVSLIVRVALFQHFSIQTAVLMWWLSVYFAINRIFSCKQIAMFELG